MDRRLVRSVIIFAAIALPALVRAAEPAIIAAARAFVGSESTLEGVKAVRFAGTLVKPDPKQPGATIRVAIELAFQHADRQIITTASDQMIETTVLDGYDAWQEQRDPRDPSKRRVSLPGPEQIRRLRASTWENLSYFRGLEARGGMTRVELEHTAKHRFGIHITTEFQQHRAQIVHGIQMLWIQRQYRFIYFHGFFGALHFK